MGQNSQDILLRGAFELSYEEARPLLEIINNGITGPGFSKSFSILQRLPLSFYEGDLSLVIVQENSPARQARGAYILEGTYLLPFEHTLDALLELNTARNLTLTEDNLPLYIRYYLNVLEGPRFDLMETLGDHPDTLFMDEDAKKQASILIKQPQATQTKTGFDVTAVLFHEGQIFQAEMQIDKDGRVTITNDRLLPLENTRPSPD